MGKFATVIILLDTHVIVWFRAAPDRLGRKALKMLCEQKSEIKISAVSSLEIAQLVFRGRLSLPCSVADWMDESFRIFQCEETPVNTAAATEAYRLPGEFHADPADRLLVATARLRGWKLMTSDQRILQYEHAAAIPAEL